MKCLSLASFSACYAIFVCVKIDFFENNENTTEKMTISGDCEKFILAFFLLGTYFSKKPLFKKNTIF